MWKNGGAEPRMEACATTFPITIAYIPLTDARMPQMYSLDVIKQKSS
jgi:hypothetical protein